MTIWPSSWPERRERWPATVRMTASDNVALLCVDDFQRALEWIVESYRNDDSNAHIGDLHLVFLAQGPPAWDQFRQLRTQAGLPPEP